MVYRTSITPFFSLRRDIDRLFEDALGRDGSMPGWAPAVDVREDERELTFEFELPGIAPEQVEVTADNGVLTVRGEKQAERKEDTGEQRHHVVERSYGSFLRAFQLPQTVNAEGIDAEFENGVLRVHVPKAELPQPKKIQIRSAGGSNAGAVRGGKNENARSGRGGKREEEPASADVR